MFGGGILFCIEMCPIQDPATPRGPPLPLMDSVSSLFEFHIILQLTDKRPQVAVVGLVLQVAGCSSCLVLEIDPDPNSDGDGDPDPHSIDTILRSIEKTGKPPCVCVCVCNCYS